MDEPLVSVIVPVYNTEKYLNKCVDSILNQTYKNLEVILIDDGSTDSSPKICDEYVKKDNRIKTIHKKNGGSASARESGVDNITGEYTIFVDSDDWIDDNLITECLNKFDNKSVDCVLYSYVKEHENNSVNISLLDSDGEYDSIFIVRRIVGEIGDELKAPERLNIFSSMCMKMYKAEILKKGKFFDTQYVGSCEDGLFNIYALYGSNKCYYINKQFYHYRKHRGETLSSSFRKDFFSQWKNLFFEFEQFIEINNLGCDFKEALKNRISLSMLGLGLNELSNPNRKQIKKNLKKYLRDEQIKNALKDFNLRILSLKWKPFMFCCKYTLVLLLYLLLKIISKVRENR